MFPRVVLGEWQEGGGPLKWHVPFFKFLLGGSNAENWGDYRKKNFFINSVELSTWDGLMETVKYIWVNILYHAWLDFLTNLQKFITFVYTWSTSEEYKILDAVVPDRLLAFNTSASSYQIEEYKNSSLVVILHCLNSFQHYNYVAFSLFICTA